MASILKLDTIQNVNGAVALDIAKLSAGGRYTRQIITQTDTASYSFTTTWGLGPTYPTLVDMKAGSLIRLDYTMPCRNDSTSWGGMYIEPQFKINTTAWQSLGSCGYDGSIMNFGNAAIGTYCNAILVNPEQVADFTVQFRFYFRSYDGTSVLNSSHDINAVSGTASIMAGNNGLQHFSHVIVEELALLRGAA